MEGLPERGRAEPIWDRLGLAEGLEVLAAVEAARGRHRVAARRLGAAWALREEMRAPVPLYLKKRTDALADALRRSLSAPVFDAEMEAGRALPSDRIVEELRSGASA
jgi:hypothetical protein